jgi:hypothetical protein
MEYNEPEGSNIPYRTPYCPCGWLEHYKITKQSNSGHFFDAFLLKAINKQQLELTLSNSCNGMARYPSSSSQTCNTEKNKNKKLVGHYRSSTQKKMFMILFNPMIDTHKCWTLMVNFLALSKCGVVLVGHGCGVRVQEQWAANTNLL